MLLLSIIGCSCATRPQEISSGDELVLALTPSPIASPTIYLTAMTQELIPSPAVSNIPTLSSSDPWPTPTSVITIGQIIIQSDPKGATVDITDMGIRGQTPFSGTLPSGNYTITLNLQGFQSWTDRISVSAMQTTTVQALLDAYEYIKIEQLDSTKYLTYLGWSTDGRFLIYAIQKEGVSAEGQNWAWWQYDLLTREKTSLAPPQSQIDEVTRQKLNLCPLVNELSANFTPCPAFSILMESPISDLIIFSPLTALEETWLSSRDGSNPQKLDIPGSPSYIDWSSDGQWLIIGINSFGLPGQRLYFLVSTDGSIMQRLDQLTKHYSLHVSGLSPRFSPNGNYLAYFGAQNPETYIESDYKLYALDLDTFETKLISERFGPFQWTENGSGLYILDNGIFPVTENAIEFNVRESTLYYANLTQDESQEIKIASNISYYPKNSLSAWLWAFSPSSNAIAYVGLQPEEELGILFLSSSE